MATGRVAGLDRSSIAWHVAIDGGHLVPDLTGPVDEGTCAARAEFRRPAERVTHRAFCTRRSGHTGRHAAGDGMVVLAVWSGPAPERRR